jgi:hypothetical protein
MYVRDGAPPLALCVSRAAEAGNPTAPRIDAAHGMTLASWRDATHDFVWVGEIDAQALRGLAEAARRAYSG